MPLTESSLVTIDDMAKIREAVLGTLSSKGYKVQQDLQTKIIAKHSFSVMYYPHVVEIDLTSGSGRTTIVLRMDHRYSQIYMSKLTQELTKVLPPVET